jgi:GT2 family glycosyltransferase
VETIVRVGDGQSGEPVVSVLILTHSVREDLERCLASVRAHAGVPVQVVVVDNGSTDGTQDWLRAEYPEIELVELPVNIGTAARQHGLDRARGRYTLFLDSDAQLTEGALPALVAALDEHPEWGLVGPELVYGDGSPQPSARRFPPLVLPFLRRPPLGRFFEDSAPVRRHLMTDIAPDRARPVVYVLGACQLFRTELARKAGRWDERIFWGPDDADWCIRIRDAGGEIVWFPHATVIHSYRRQSSKTPFSRTALHHLQGFYYFQWKYRKRKRELARLGRELDRRAAAA